MTLIAVGDVPKYSQVAVHLRMELRRPEDIAALAAALKIQGEWLPTDEALEAIFMAGVRACMPKDANNA